MAGHCATLTGVVASSIATKTPPPPGDFIVRVASGAVATDLTGFIIRVDLSDLPDFFFDDLNPTGSNIWVTDQSEARVPVDVIKCDPALKTGEVFFRSQNLYAASDNDFKIFGGADVPDDTSPYYKTNVWSGYDVILINPDLYNRRDPTQVPIGTPGSSGGWWTFGGGARLRYTLGTTARRNNWTLGATFRMSALGAANRAVASYGFASTSDASRATIIYRGASARMSLWDASNGQLDAATPVPAIGARHRINAAWASGSSRRLFIDGTLRNEQIAVTQKPSTGSALYTYFGAEDESSAELFTGDLNYLYLRATALSGDWLAAEYASWETSGFYTVI